MTFLSTTLGVAGGLVGVGLVLWPVGIWWEVRKCEKPNYTVVRSLAKKQGWFSSVNTVEIRRYAPYLIAEVLVQGGDMNNALSQGFRQIAGFIFGKNTAVGKEQAEKVAMTSPVRLEMQEGAGSEKIAMTSPVAAEMAGDGSYKVSFVMPSKYTLDTLPKPHNSNISIHEVPSRTLAAISFGGNSPREAEVERYKAKLMDVLQKHDIKPEGEEVMLYQYHPPFAPWFMRLNEVLLPVEDSK